MGAVCIKGSYTDYDSLGSSTNEDRCHLFKCTNSGSYGCYKCLDEEICQLFKEHCQNISISGWNPTQKRYNAFDEYTKKRFIENFLQKDPQICLKVFKTISTAKRIQYDSKEMIIEVSCMQTLRTLVNNEQIFENYTTNAYFEVDTAKYSGFEINLSNTSLEVFDGDDHKKIIYIMIAKNGTPINDDDIKSDSIKIIKDLSQVLSILHKKAHFHRDIKPANIVKRDGKYMLIDWAFLKISVNFYAGSFPYLHPCIIRHYKLKYKPTEEYILVYSLANKSLPYHTKYDILYLLKKSDEYAVAMIVSTSNDDEVKQIFKHLLSPAPYFESLPPKQFQEGNGGKHVVPVATQEKFGNRRVYAVKYLKVKGEFVPYNQAIKLLSLKPKNVV